MGNVVSKKKSTREKIIQLDKIIMKTETNKKKILRSLSQSYKIFILILLVLITLFSFYTYIEEYNIFIGIGMALVTSLTIRFLVHLVFNWRLDVFDTNLNKLKEDQKVLINKLKEEEDYKQTLEVLGKYDESSIRNESFSRVKQKPKKAVDAVADFVLGDDPSQVYALICKNCHYHNGMVHPSEEVNVFMCYNCETKNERKLYVKK